MDGLLLASVLILWCSLAGLLSSSELPAESDDALDTWMGEYVGLFSAPGSQVARAEAKVIAEGDGRYRARLTLLDENPRTVSLTGKLAERAVSLTGADDNPAWRGTITGGLLTATSAHDEGKGEGKTFRLVRIERESPTAGLRPPQYAVVLLSYEPGQPPALDHWTNKNWKALADGSVQVTGGHNRTLQPHGSGLFHIEFKIPYEPAGRGQGRGNSGVYFASRYEIQVLDSFGLEPGPGDCGAIYGVAVARANACLPPLKWQTYDVIYHAPHKGAGGELEPATMTVFHNGVRIHENQPVPAPTRAAPEGSNAVQGPLFLQDHGHPVGFRNIWYLPLED